jgi:molybdopterin-guanine dinucleotide biosynthesis protein MobB
MFDHLPVLGICGWSNAGKTTLLEQMVPVLANRKLNIAVVKHDIHGIAAEPGGKDSARLRRAGADVVVCGPTESLMRQAGSSPRMSLEWQVWQLAAQYDLVLVEGLKHAPWPKIWLMSGEQDGPPSAIGNVVAVMPHHGDRVGSSLAILADYLRASSRRAPAFGCILIGGKSSRMGAAKHLLPYGPGGRRTLLEHTVDSLQAACQRIVLAGAGTVPTTASQLWRLPDVPHISGPMAGLLAAMRWAPLTSWILAACDLPQLSVEAITWLLDQRSPGVWAILPTLSGAPRAEPLLAFYDFRLRPYLENVAQLQQTSLHAVVDHPKTVRVIIPRELADAWHDVDTPDECAQQQRQESAAKANHAQKA